MKRWLSPASERVCIGFTTQNLLRSGYGGLETEFNVCPGIVTGKYLALIGCLLFRTSCGSVDWRGRR